MSSKKRRRKPMGEINVVPYIDVTLVLLIIFMITTPLLQTGVQVELPETDSAVIEQGDQSPIIISVKKDGSYYFFFADEHDQPEPMEPDQIKARVMAVLEKKPKTQVQIEGDKEVDYGAVVTIMASLKNAGVSNVGLSTQPITQ